MDQQHRTADVRRDTNETKIRVRLDLDGSGKSVLATGIGFFDHMLDQIARHGLIDLDIACEGDLHIDGHHTVEDVGITLGMAVAKAIGDKKGIRRYGHAYVPLDEALVEIRRVLRPGGYFLYADFRFSDGLTPWETAMENAPLKLMQSREISAEVLRGMDANSARSVELLDKKLPKFLHSLGRDFAGVKGSRVYNALLDGSLSYRSYCFQKPLQPATSV